MGGGELQTISHSIIFRCFPAVWASWSRVRYELQSALYRPVCRLLIDSIGVWTIEVSEKGTGSRTMAGRWSVQRPYVNSPANTPTCAEYADIASSYVTPRCVASTCRSWCRRLWNQRAGIVFAVCSGDYGRLANYYDDYYYAIEGWKFSIHTVSIADEIWAD